MRFLVTFVVLRALSNVVDSKADGGDGELASIRRSLADLQKNSEWTIQVLENIQTSITSNAANLETIKAQVKQITASSPNKGQDSTTTTQSPAPSSSTHTNVQGQALNATCGGVITVATNLTLMDFESSTASLPCVWVIDSSYSELSVYIDFQMLPPEAGLTFFYAQGADPATRTLAAYKLPKTDDTWQTFHLPQRFAYIVLSSAGDSGQGFRLGFKAAMQVARAPGFNLHRASRTGTFISHTNRYVDNEDSAIVFQPTEGVAMTVRVARMDAECPHDPLKVYVLKPYHELNRTLSTVAHYRVYCETSGLSGQNSVIISKEPLAYLFHSDGSTTRNGFSLEWY